ncbi:hypothetical protein ACXR2T_13630 [Leucobacter sp. HY1910]
MGEEKTPEVKRLRLTGARFEHGHLPIDSLVELQKYQELHRIAARAKWRHDNPGEEIPADFDDSVRLAIESINEGSADIALGFEQIAVYAEYRVAAEDAVDSAIASAYSNSDHAVLLPEYISDDESVEFRHTATEFGETLKGEQTIEVYRASPDSPAVSISLVTRPEAVKNLVFEEDFLVSEAEQLSVAKIEPREASLVGRVIVIEAGKKTFTLELADGHTVKGWYKKDQEKIEDLREVIDSPSEAPLTRVTGTLSFKDGKPFRINPVDSIEQLEFDETSWGLRLAKFASLLPGWSDGEGEQISSVALDAAQVLLREAFEFYDETPGVFPTEDGGILVEWADRESVLSAEITSEGAFELFAMGRSDDDGEHEETRDVKKALDFLRGGGE